MSIINQKGVIHTLPLLIIVAAVGIISFLLISSTAPFKGGLFGILNPRPVSHAATTVNGVPLCDGQNGRPNHDWTKWHPLVEKNPDGSILCTYGHEHGIDPKQSDDVFGQLPLSQEISYPWRTVSSTGIEENQIMNKHRVYKWLALKNAPCIGSAPSGENNSVTSFREELHADGSLGAAVRFHSYWGQYELTNCTTGQKGYISTGGHIDYATLTVGFSKTRVPLSSDPAASCTINGDTRQEGSLNETEQVGSVWYGTNSRDSTCGAPYDVAPNGGYGPSVGVQVNVGTDGWGPVDPNNPTAVLFYPNREIHRGTAIGSDAITFYVGGFPADSNGLVNFTGHTNAEGAVVPEVAGKAESPDYIPLTIQNVYQRPGNYSAYIFDQVKSGVAPSYDGDVPGPNGESGYYVQNPDTTLVIPSSTPISTATPTPIPTPTSTPTPALTPPTVNTTAFCTNQSSGVTINWTANGILFNQIATDPTFPTWYNKDLTSTPTQSTTAPNGFTLRQTTPPAPLTFSQGQTYFVRIWDGTNTSTNTSFTIPVCSTPTPTPITSCPKAPLGDIDCNGTINIFDYNLLITNFGKTVPVNTQGDLDGNGLINIFDFNILITNFGK